MPVATMDLSVLSLIIYNYNTIMINLFFYLKTQQYLYLFRTFSSITSNSRQNNITEQILFENNPSK